jgi:hypothetical protein
MSVDMQVTNYEITVMSRILVSKQILRVDIATLCKNAALAKQVGTT